jgi:hypothetical protein
MESQFVCTRCQQAYPHAGNCPVHPEEPWPDAAHSPRGWSASSNSSGPATSPSFPGYP